MAVENSALPSHNNFNNPYILKNKTAILKCF